MLWKKIEYEIKQAFFSYHCTIMIKVNMLIVCNDLLTADILESGSDDFESGEDIHDAVGSILAEVAGDEGEDDIVDICNQLMSGLKGYVP